MDLTYFHTTYINAETSFPDVYAAYIASFVILLVCMLLSLGLAAWYDYRTMNIPLKAWLPMCIPLGYSIIYILDNYLDPFGVLAFVPIFIFIIMCWYLTTKGYIHTADLIGLTLLGITVPSLMAFNITSTMTIPELAPYVLFAMTIFFMLPTRFYYWYWVDKKQTKFFSGYIPYFVPVLPAFIVTLFNPLGL